MAQSGLPLGNQSGILRAGADHARPAHREGMKYGRRWSLAIIERQALARPVEVQPIIERNWLARLLKR